jgi:hypothetical protein
LPISAGAGKSLQGKPGAEVVSPVRAGSAQFLGNAHNLSAVDANMPKVINLDWRVGDNTVPARLGDSGFFTDTDYAKKHHLHAGSVVNFQFPSGKRTSLRLIGTYKKPKGGTPFGEAIISTALFDKQIPRPQDQMVLVNTPGGVTDANTQTLKNDVKGFADAKVQTREQFSCSTCCTCCSACR